MTESLSRDGSSFATRSAIPSPMATTRSARAIDLFLRERTIAPERTSHARNAVFARDLREYVLQPHDELSALRLDDGARSPPKASGVGLHDRDVARPDEPPRELARAPEVGEVCARALQQRVGARRRRRHAMDVHAADHFHQRLLRAR
jgi:hypothetical protein